MTAVIAVLKAGGAYLPVDPGYPPGRIAAMLARADCALVLTEPGASRNLERALEARPGTRTLLVPAVAGSTARADDPGIPVAADRLAYVYFTSGSTGEPKGALCEHAGMLNHLLAKIDDLGIEEGQVVAQTASQCFDISLWQLLAGPLAGGRTLLVDQEAVLDADRFSTPSPTAGSRCSRSSLVPRRPAVRPRAHSPPAARPAPRVGHRGGAAQGPRTALVRCAARRPLVNAYGLTETSDDTNHEVLTGVPDGDRIPLGRPVPNVRVYVVDDDLVPVPSGPPEPSSSPGSAWAAAT